MYPEKTIESLKLLKFCGANIIVIPHKIEIIEYVDFYMKLRKE